MQHRLLPGLLAIALTACATAGPAPVPAPAPASTLDAAVAGISATDVQRRVSHLASDALQGRDTPSPGLDAAAQWAADEFRRMGLEPVNGEYIHTFPFDASQLDRTRVRVEARAGNRTESLAFATDYFVIPARVDSAAGAPLFLGAARPGILAPADAAGRPLLFFVPDTAMAAWQQSAGLAVQAAGAARAGAIVLIMDPEFSPETLRMLANELTGQIMPLPMPIVGVSYAAAKRIFALSSLDLDQLRTGTAATPVNAQMSIVTPVGGEQVQAPNVVAMLPGADSALRNEYVVFSAHFDHVGVGDPDEQGDSIFNGADDNASGTTAVLEIAEAFAMLQPRPRRSILFVLVSGEEKGLLGSQAFVQDPPVPAAQMVANINLDMVGRNAPDSVVAIGLDYTTLGATVQRVRAAHPELNLVVAPDLWPEEQLFFRSDHFSFAAQDIPAIFFTTGLHDQYHKPSDEADLIDNDKIARISRLLFRLALDVANTTERPQWTEAGRAAMRAAMGQ